MWAKRWFIVVSCVLVEWLGFCAARPPRIGCQTESGRTLSADCTSWILFSGRCARVRHIGPLAVDQLCARCALRLNLILAQAGTHRPIDRDDIEHEAAHQMAAKFDRRPTEDGADAKCGAKELENWMIDGDGVCVCVCICRMNFGSRFTWVKR